MTPLGEALVERIRRDGPIPVDAYMTMCLSDPAHGYYRKADAVGAAGDFITAPEISQMFGELLGLWAADMWSRMGRPVPVRLVEIGPGRGTLMADALRAIARASPPFAAAIELHLVEINETLRQRQFERLNTVRPVWHADLGAVPPGPMLILANEFFDTLPVRQFRRDAAGWRERMVGLEDGALALIEGPPVADPPLEPAHRSAPIGAVVEASPAARALAGAVARRIAQDGIAALIVDYGPLASGVGDTLQAVRRHRKIGPLEAPGESDLTAHVDFAALARAAREASAAAYGPVPQGVFLHRLGILARAAALLRNASAAQARDIEAACARLIGAEGMGTLFKALAILPPGAAAPPGFDPIAATETLRAPC